MRYLPLFRFNRRARSTSWGIALCTMFIVASFSVASGLRVSMDTLADNFTSQYSLVSYPGESGMDFFETSSLGAAEARSAFCVVVVASAGTDSVVVFSVSDPGGVLDETFSASGQEVKVGMSVPISGNVTFVAETSQEATVVSRFSSSMFPSTWVLGSEGMVAALAGSGTEEANLALSEWLTDEERSRLESAGFSVQPMVSIVEFLDSSVAELESDAYWVLVPSAFVIAVLAYSFIGAEVADKRREVGIIKTIGASRRRVFSYLLAESALMCAYGGALGLALGIVMSYAVSTFASHIFSSVFVIEIEEVLLLMAFSVTVCAGILGAIIPTVRMTMSSPVQDLREVVSF